ncbi:hypothetical protein ABT160_29860 [Streptomyces sp. NPDC001941]|uniref:hypothetical protein n=1 Tax=Streptomyces sp. NPDC001941 TaxID=3154659 RepID=UPI00332480B2
MQHETTINQLATYPGLFSTVDHITVHETHPDTGLTEEVTLPPPLIRRTQRRDNTVLWVLTPPGIHERIFVADQAPVTVYLTPTHPAPQPPPTPPPHTPPAPWPAQHTTPPAAHHPTPQPPTPQRTAAPWTNPHP